SLSKKVDEAPHVAKNLSSAYRSSVSDLHGTAPVGLLTRVLLLPVLTAHTPVCAPSPGTILISPLPPFCLFPILPLSWIPCALPHPSYYYYYYYFLHPATSDPISHDFVYVTRNVMLPWDRYWNAGAAAYLSS
ncbi:hypothetical protein PanWU01x14_283890, partial [Parasponia andersonii]